MATEDESQHELTLSEPAFHRPDMMVTLTLNSPAGGIGPPGGEQKNSARSGARATATATSTSTHIDVHDEEHYDNETEPNVEESRPRRRLFRVVSRCLPFLLTAVVAYIYYVYTVRVCIQYLLHFKRNAVQASLYLAIFNVVILLFFVSYALSILRAPGSPSNPPVRVPPPIIPLTTTPYRPRITLPSSFHYGSSQGGVSSPGPSSSLAMAPTTGQSSHLPHTRTASSATGTSSLHSYSHSLATSNAQHSSPYLGSVTTAPKYPVSAVAPVSPGEVASEAHLEIPIPPESHGQTSMASRGHSLGIGSGHHNHTGGGGMGRVSPDNPGPGLRSRHATDESGQQQPIATLSVSKRDGRPRWCQFCKTVKPDRCHHCSECNRCVLRMDHHCPWVNGCIGFGNYKYFYLFIFYGSVAALWVVVTMVPLILQAFQDCELDQEPPRSGGYGSRIRGGSPTFAADLIPRMMLASREKSSWVDVDVDHLAPRSVDVHWIVITVLAFLLALLIVSFTGAHTAYILNNRTTIESLQDTRNMFIRVQYRKMDFNGDEASANAASLPSLPATGPLPSFMSEIEFNVVMIEHGERLWDRGSWAANWKSVMGRTWWLWFLPYHNTPGDGIHEVYNEKVYSRLVADALAQARMQVINFGGPGDELAVQGISNDNESSSNAELRDHLETIAVAPPSPHLERISTTEITALPGPSSAPLPSSKSLSSRLGSSGSNSPRDAIGGSSSGSKRSVQKPALRRSSSASAAVMLPSIRFETAPDAPTLDPQSRAAIELQIRSSCSPEAALVRTSNDGSSSRGGRASGYSTPMQTSARSQSPRQRSPKSPSHAQPQSESSRRRQRTMSGGTSGSFGVAAREFGMGLGMDGIPVDSGTGLKLSSGLLGRPGQSYGKGHGRQQSYQ
ncbi:unnamed protein product [Mortierella alpina]